MPHTPAPIPAPVADWVTIPDLYRDPYPIYRRLRAEGGVHWVPAVDRYLITSYDAVSAIEHDQETFSANEAGSLQIRAMGHSMLRRDDPEHYVERKQWQTVLRPGAVKRVWMQVFERNADRYLSELIDTGEGADLIWDFAAAYTAENLREILGFYNVTHSDLQRWSQTMIDGTGNYADDPEVWANAQRSFDEVDDALDEMLHWHAAHPDDSLISSLLAIPEGRMPIAKIRANMKMTIGGGVNEPRDALGVAAWALLTHPDQRRAAEADPSLWPTVFEESIRWISPIGMFSRQATRETDLTGVTLPAGARLGVCILSANRDESVWQDAAAFDIHREVKPHLAFSKGVHACLGNWVARAEVAAVALPKLFSRLRGLDLVPETPATLGGWVFRGMLTLPVRWDAVAPADPTPVVPAPGAAAEPAAPAPRIAIVGSGPAGCFTAQALQRTLPAARLEIFDRLPVPYGLVRYGVAADHQGTKSVAHQFDRLFARGDVTFHGNTHVGDDVTLDELRAHYDAVVLATGLHADAALAVPGADHPGVFGAGRLTRLLNSHPDEAGMGSLGRDVVVIGQGNVAVDVVRLLTRDEAGLDGSDVNDAVRTELVRDIRTVHVVGRSPAGRAKFDPVMVRELAGLPGVAHRVHGVDLNARSEGKDARLDALRAAVAAPEAGARVTVHWWFGLTPRSIDGAQRVESVTFDGADGEITLSADAVIAAVGFTASHDTPAVPGAHPDGRVEPGLYVAGWLRRGPRGTIPDQRVDARGLAKLIAEDVASGAVTAAGVGVTPHPGAVDFGGWRRIDLRERLSAAPGRVRAKLVTRDELLAAARDLEVLEAALPPLTDDADGGSGSGGVPMTLLFGTESGGAELVADDLRQYLAGRAELTVADLGDVDPSDLDTAQLHLVVCSTYGDGEVPTSARPFHAALRRGGVALGGLRYAVFGMGDKSYAKTYSRGSELIDEALTACGAERFGAYGRHDAGGHLDATEAARNWADDILATLDALGESAWQTAPVGSSELVTEG